MRNVRSVIAAAMVAVSINPGMAQTDSGPIIIGSSIPLTGGVAAFGQHSRWGAEMALAEANARTIAATLPRRSRA